MLMNDVSHVQTCWIMMANGQLSDICISTCVISKPGLRLCL